MHHPIPLLLCCLTIGAAACSDDSTIESNEFADQYPVAYCSFLQSCCDAAERSYNSTSSCQEAVRKQVDALLQAVSGNADYDGEAARSCLNDLEQKSCSNAKLLYGCMNGAVTARQAEGDDCSYSAECTTYNCIPGSGGKQGYCGAAATTSGGCSGDDRGCAAGTYCSPYKKCTDKKQVGESCAGPNECASFVCHRNMHKCVDPATTPICQ